jgi:type IV pilus biogenesis protein CpaD/CtpE
MSTRFHMARGALLALAATLAGCASTTPQWDSRFGDSVRASLAAQVADPAAARNPNPVAGIDARAASAAQTRYERSFQEAVVPVSIIGAGAR